MFDSQVGAAKVKIGWIYVLWMLSLVLGGRELRVYYWEETVFCGLSLCCYVTYVFVESEFVVNMYF